MANARVPSAETKMSVSEMTEKYLQLRNRKRELQERHKEQLSPYNNMIAQLAGMILGELNAAGVDSMRSADGTVYKSTETSVTVKDWPVALAYVQARQAWDLLEARIGKVAALAEMAETGEPIPGVSVHQEIVLRVRSS